MRPASASTVIPISSATDVARSVCGGCLHSAAGPVCRVDAGEPCEAPALVGPADQLARVMVAMDEALASDGVRGGGWVQSLRLGDGEAELTLAVEPRCGGLALADHAFHALRGLLPDTDIYVRHAQPD